MSLIPITFKADLGDDNPKGNITPEILSDLFAFLYPKTAGILNITGQDCSFIGQPSIVGSTATIGFHKGIIVIFGRAIYISEDTRVSFNLPNAGTVNGVLGVRINLAENGNNEVVWFQKENVEITDNLMQKPETGIYEFVLYNYTATSNTFVLGDKTNQIIQNIKDEDFTTLSESNSSKKIATTEFVSNKLATVLQFSKQTGSNLTETSNGRQNVHNFTVLDFLGTRLIYGTISALEANRPTTVSWGSALLSSSSIDKAVFIPSFTTQERTNPNSRGMDEPCHIMQTNIDGFVIYNSNAYTVTGTYLVIGEKP